MKQECAPENRRFAADSFLEYYLIFDGNTGMDMANALTVKGQVTIPKRIREALGLKPGDGVDFDVNERGEVLLRRAGEAASGAAAPDRFERAVGTAEVRWRTDELMALLRPPE